jgi:uncharacterized protein
MCVTTKHNATGLFIRNTAMPAHLYQASVPVFMHYLERLEGLVNSAESYAICHSINASDLLAARLAPDMLPFELQVRIAANFALRACFPLVGQDVPPFGEFPATFQGLQAAITRIKALVSSLQPTQFNGAESRLVQDRAGQAIVSLPAAEFLLQYALPNFFFHMVAAYTILRSRGVVLGKNDFDGFHSYLLQRTSHGV